LKWDKFIVTFELEIGLYLSINYIDYLYRKDIDALNGDKFIVTFEL
jgi:hypothetical protein